MYPVSHAVGGRVKDRMEETGIVPIIDQSGQHPILGFINGTRTSLVSNVIDGYQEI